jgi:hypothetical protein
LKAIEGVSCGAGIDQRPFLLSDAGFLSVTSKEGTIIQLI